jgi:hypothetical protein
MLADCPVLIDALHDGSLPQLVVER